MSRLSHRFTIVTALFVILLVLPSCTKQTQTAPKPLWRFAVVTGGQTTDPFWSGVKQGADQAAAKMKVAVSYLAPNTLNTSTMSALIDAAIATHPDGLVVSIPDCAGLTSALKRAQLVGIPIISINAGSDCASKLGLLNHVGQGGYQIGLEAGQKLVDEGAKHVVCINPEVGNVDLDDRCRGINDVLTQAGGRSEVLAIDLSDPIIAQQTIQQKLIQEPSIDSAIAVNAATAALTVNALQPSDQGYYTKQVIVATLDLTPEVSQLIQQGTILFAIDQRQYWQGYVSIELMVQYKEHTHTLAAPTSTADPGVVTKENAG